ncbi:MAG: hypothetical protein VYA60_10720 [Pseudomonadota bacterium]|nr:hypothetical protein [Pseudomonadota bacterium]
MKTTNLNNVKNGLSQIHSSAVIGINENQAELTLNIDGDTAVCSKKAWVLGTDEYSNLGSSTATVKSMEEVFNFFGRDWLSRSLYELAGITYDPTTDVEGLERDKSAILTPIGPEVLNFIEKCDEEDLVNKDKETAGVYYVGADWVEHANSLSSNKQTTASHSCVKTKQFHIEKDGEVFAFSTRKVTICKSLDEIGQFFSDNRMGQLVYKNLLNNQK